MRFIAHLNEAVLFFQAFQDRRLQTILANFHNKARLFQIISSRLNPTTLIHIRLNRTFMACSSVTSHLNNKVNDWSHHLNSQTD